MNKSRFSLLLAVALFVAPAMVIATDAVTPDAIIEQTKIVDATNEDNSDKTSDVTKKDAKSDAKEEAAVSPEAKAGMVAAVTAFIAARRTNVNSGLDTVASYTFNPILTKLASFDCLKGGKFENNIPTMNRALVGTAAVALAYAAYKAIVAQNDSNEDFDADFDADSN